MLYRRVTEVRAQSAGGSSFNFESTISNENPCDGGYVCVPPLRGFKPMWNILHQQQAFRVKLSDTSLGRILINRPCPLICQKGWTADNQKSPHRAQQETLGPFRKRGRSL